MKGSFTILKFFLLCRRFVFMMGLLLITGLGSWMFHMTLWYEMQLLDELPMVWGSAGMVYILREIKSNVPNYRLGFSLLLYCLTFTVLYLCKFTSPYVFQTLYGILVVVILVVGIQLVATHPDKIGIKLFLLAILNYGVGFALWNIDNQLCPDLSHMRYRYVAKTLRPLTQFHALWHLLAGYATYLQILTCLYYRYKFKKFLTTLQWSNWRGFYIRISSKSKEE